MATFRGARWDRLEDGAFGYGPVTATFYRFQNIRARNYSTGILNGPQVIDSQEIILFSNDFRFGAASVFKNFGTRFEFGTGNYYNRTRCGELEPTGYDLFAINGTSWDIETYNSTFHDGGGAVIIPLGSQGLRAANYANFPTEYFRVTKTNGTAQSQTIPWYPRVLSKTGTFYTHDIVMRHGETGSGFNPVTNLPSPYQYMLTVYCAITGSSAALGFYDDGTPVATADLGDYTNFPFTLTIASAIPVSNSGVTFQFPFVICRTRFRRISWETQTGSGATQYTANPDSLLPYSDGESLYVYLIAP